MTERIALISDIHGNSPALRAVLADIESQRCTRLYMLGDLVAGVDPQGCVDLLRDWCAAHSVELSCLRGNAEAYLLTPDLLNLPRQEEQWNVDMIELVLWWRAHLSSETLHWLASFPELLVCDGSTLLVHDSPLDRLSVRHWHVDGIEPKYQEWFYHAPGFRLSTPEKDWQALHGWLDVHQHPYLFCAHTHAPFLRTLGTHLVCNTGSVGIPLDGDSRASWALFTPAASAAPISLRRVEYDLGQIHQLIDETSDYPDFQDLDFREIYKTMLSSGRHWKALLHDLLARAETSG